MIHKTLILSLAAACLTACTTAPPPPPVQRAPAISLQPIADGNRKIQQSSDRILIANEKARDALDRAIVANHQAAEAARAAELDRAKILKATQDAEAAALEAKAQNDAITKDNEQLKAAAVTQEQDRARLQAQADAAHALAEHNADLADQRGVANAKYVQQEKEDDRWWGWHGVARSIGHAIWRSAWHLFLFVGLPILLIIGGLILLNFLVPGLPFAGKFLAYLGKIPFAIVRAFSSLWPSSKKPPPN